MNAHHTDPAPDGPPGGRSSGAEEARVLRAMLDGHPELLIVSLDRSYRCLAFNQRAREGLQEMFGFAVREGMDVLSHIEPPSIRERLRVSFDRALAGESFTLVRRQPELDAYYEGTWVPLRSADGEVAGATAYFLDVTARIQAQEQLRKLSVAVEQSPASVVITNLDGDIEYVNAKFTRLTGYSADEVKGRNPRILNSGKLAPEVYREMWHALQSGQEWFGEFHNRKKNGDLFWEEAAISPIFDSEGKITHFLAIKEDVTARKQMEEQLRQSQKMEAVGQLAGGVAHDFNNLLTVINGYSDMVLAALDASDPSYELMQEIAAAGNRAATLTRQLLAFSRKQVLQPRVLDINELIHRMEKMLTRLIDESVRIETRLAPDLGPVKADPGQIEQVVLNLVLNARDAMPHGGVLEVSTRNVELPVEELGNTEPLEGTSFIRLSITDTGTGIDPDTLARIFEPFFTTKGIEKGTGLGLATVYGIVRQSGGDIRVKSTPGKGSTFDVLLPRIQAEGLRPEPESPPREEAPYGAETILVVEDENAVRELASSSLKEYGYTVLIATDGADALRRLQDYSGPLDLLLTDVIMPNMSGKELASRLSVDRPDLRVLYMSGYTDASFAAYGILDEDTHFIQKPFTAVDLARKVRQIVDSFTGPADPPDRS